MGNKVVNIYENGIYFNDGSGDFIETNKFTHIFYESLDHIRELDDNEILNSLEYFEEEGVWKAQIWLVEEQDFIYIDVDQSIFKEEK